MYGISASVRAASKSLNVFAELIAPRKEAGQEGTRAETIQSSLRGRTIRDDLS